jgi:hypothetical protein
MKDALNVWLGLEPYDWMKPKNVPRTNTQDWGEFDMFLGNTSSPLDNPTSDSDNSLSQTKEDRNSKRKKEESGEEPKKKKSKTKAKTPR